MNNLSISSTAYYVLQSTLIITLISFLAISCDDINTSGPNSETGQMNVSLTDAPGNYQEVNVDVQGLRIHYTPTSDDTATADGKWIDLPVDPMTVNLLELTNGVDTLLSSAELDPGNYKELRLILGDENTVMIDDEIKDLKVPSGQQSGYKIKFNTELEEGEELDVIIDFDAGQSVHQAGKSGKYILKPVLKAFVEDSDEVGSIAGAVEPADAAPFVYAIMNDDTTGTQADENGNFLIQGLEGGQYDLNIEPTDGEHADTTLTSITVEEGEKTDVETIILSESD